MIPGSPQPAVLSWSGGKDSVMALHAMRQGGRHDVIGLLTTCGEADGLVPIHRVHRDLLRRQADALGLPIRFVPLPAAATNLAYEAALIEALATQHRTGARAIAFGDLFLADIRAYREQLVARTQLTPVFPLWGSDTRDLVRRFIAAGFRAIVVAVDLAVLDATFAGRMLDTEFLAALPPHVDPCGENGESHSFVFDGPGFSRTVEIRREGVSTHDGVCCCNLV